VERVCPCIFDAMKRIELKVVPGAKHNAWKQEAGMVKVYLTAPAVDGKANQALVVFLAEHFQTRKSRIKIIKGLKSRTKTVTINDS